MEMNREKKELLLDKMTKQRSKMKSIKAAVKKYEKLSTEIMYLKKDLNLALSKDTILEIQKLKSAIARVESTFDLDYPELVLLWEKKEDSQNGEFIYLEQINDELFLIFVGDRQDDFALYAYNEKEAREIYKAQKKIHFNNIYLDLNTQKLAAGGENNE